MLKNILDIVDQTLAGLLNFFAHNISSIASALGALSSLVTIIGVLAALWWFFRRRERAPRANVTHEVKFIDLGNNTRYVGVHVHISNVGRVQIKPKINGEENSSVVTIEELSPYLSSSVVSQEFSPEYKLEPLGLRSFPDKIHVEPGEKQSVFFEYIIQKSTQSIKIYSHIDNSYKNAAGWDTTTTHEVNE